MFNNKKNLVAVIIIIVVVLLIGGGVMWYKNCQEYVKRGLAKSTFPYAKYSQDELNSLYPQTIENNAPTTQTPEETHKKFVEALKKQDFEEAVGCCVVESEKEKLKAGLEKIFASGSLPQMIKDLDQKIDKESEEGPKAFYSFATLENDKKFGHIISFLKDSKGVWLIESL